MFFKRGTLYAGRINLNAAFFTEFDRYHYDV